MKKNAESVLVVMSDPKSRTGEEDKKALTKQCAHQIIIGFLTDLSIPRIYANGGSCAQIANNQPDLFVVYGGTVTRKLFHHYSSSYIHHLFCIIAAYDLKLIIDKGKADVIKPSWILDSIEEGEQVPLRKK
jgi:DNA ligase-4